MKRVRAVRGIRRKIGRISNELRRESVVMSHFIERHPQLRNYKDPLERTRQVVGSCNAGKALDLKNKIVVIVHVDYRNGGCTYCKENIDK